MRIIFYFIQCEINILMKGLFGFKIGLCYNYLKRIVVIVKKKINEKKVFDIIR